MSDIAPRPKPGWARALRLETGCGKEFSANEPCSPAGGARRDRTDDLLLAKQALSQLSYGPFRGQMTDDR